jgi:hypothetical protein
MGLSVICAKSLIVSKAVAHIICDIYDPDRHGDRLLPTTAKPTTHKQRSRMTVESTSSAPNNLSTVHEHQQTKNVPLAILAALFHPFPFAWWQLPGPPVLSSQRLTSTCVPCLCPTYAPAPPPSLGTRSPTSDKRTGAATVKINVHAHACTCMKSNVHALGPTSSCWQPFAANVVWRESLHHRISQPLKPPQPPLCLLLGTNIPGTHFQLYCFLLPSTQL